MWPPTLTLATDTGSHMRETWTTVQNETIDTDQKEVSAMTRCLVQPSQLTVVDSWWLGKTCCQRQLDQDHCYDQPPQQIWWDDRLLNNTETWVTTDNYAQQSQDRLLFLHSQQPQSNSLHTRQQLWLRNKASACDKLGDNWAKNFEINQQILI